MSEAAFQRETLLALQDAILQVEALVREELDRRYVQDRSGEPPEGILAPPKPAGWGDALDSLSKLEVRTSDPDLRMLVARYRDQSAKAMMSTSHNDLALATTTLGESRRKIDERIGELLPKLF
jgi:hypothetical protein